jgi:hypothetical protein
VSDSHSFIPLFISPLFSSALFIIPPFKHHFHPEPQARDSAFSCSTNGLSRRVKHHTRMRALHENSATDFGALASGRLDRRHPAAE